MFGTAMEITFSSTQAKLVTIMGLAVGMLVALLLVGPGVRMLIKWARMVALLLWIRRCEEAFYLNEAGDGVDYR